MKRRARWLPSRQFVWVIGSLVVVGTLIGAAAYGRSVLPRAAAPTEEPQASPTLEARTLVVQDSDDDGLKDWEEDLWKTDPEHPDSDGDGTPDGDEVSQRRNPLVAGPDDKLNAPTDTSFAHTPVELSETDRLARALFTQYVEAGNQGVPITEETAARLVLPSLLSLQQSTSGDQLQQTYTRSDVPVVDATTSTLHAYGNAVGNLFKGDASTENNEIFALAEFAQTGNPDTVGSLAGVITTYTTRINTLLQLSVPTPLVPAHVSLLNALVAVRLGIEGFAQLSTDPVYALLGLESYRTGGDAMAASLRAIGNYLYAHDVAFGTSEGGFVLINAAEQS